MEGLSSKRAFSPTDINPRNVGLTEGRESGGSSDSSDSGNDSGDDSGKGVDGNDSSDGVIDLIKNYKCAFFIPVVIATAFPPRRELQTPTVHW